MVRRARELVVERLATCILLLLLLLSLLFLNFIPCFTHTYSSDANTHTCTCWMDGQYHMVFEFGLPSGKRRLYEFNGSARDPLLQVIHTEEKNEMHPCIDISKFLHFLPSSNKRFAFFTASSSFRFVFRLLVVQAHDKRRQVWSLRAMYKTPFDIIIDIHIIIVHCRC